MELQYQWLIGLGHAIIKIMLKKVYTSEKVLVEVTGTCLIPGDIAPELTVISGGTAQIFGMYRDIAIGTKARNPDGSVNYTQLELK